MNKVKDYKDIIFNFFANDWDKLIIIWSDLEAIGDALNIANTDERIYATIAIHPINIHEIWLKDWIEMLRNTYNANKEKIVAIWEAGLDYYRIERDLQDLDLTEEEKDKLRKEKKQKEKEYFWAQVDLAKELNLPLVIHNREAFLDVLEILQEKDFKNFIFHSWSEWLEFAKKVLDFAPNAMFSFSWVLTFKNAKNIQEVAKILPIKNILAETDSPFLTPEPLRWKEENEPIFTKYVIQKISELRWEDYEYIEENIYENSKRTFSI